MICGILENKEIGKVAIWNIAKAVCGTEMRTATRTAVPSAAMTELLELRDEDVGVSG